MSKMIKLAIRPSRKNPDDPAKPMKVIVNDYWERSVSGFGNYTKEIAPNTYKRLVNNADVYYTEDISGYRLTPKEFEKSYFIFIEEVK